MELSKTEAFSKAKSILIGQCEKRLISVNGMGFWLKDNTPRQVVINFLKNHKRAFIKSKKEQAIYNSLLSGAELDEAFNDYSADGGFVCDHWICAVVNIMLRETGICFDGFQDSAFQILRAILPAKRSSP